MWVDGDVWKDPPMASATGAPRATPRTWEIRAERAASVGGEGRILTGTAAALAAWAGVDPIVTRLAFVVLAVAGGWGVVLYAAAWALFASAVVAPIRRDPLAPADARRDVGVALIVLGLALQARLWGWGFSDTLVWPVMLLALAVGVVWRRMGSVELAGVLDDDAPGARSTTARVLAGGGLLVAGGLSLLGVELSFGDGLRAAFGLAAAVAGLALVFGPTIRATSTALLAERRERIRADERAVISSHLHDSVLQTLALIQKRSEDAAEVASLARRQERELRTWLYGERESAGGTVRSALEAAAAEVDALHRVAVECVVVGDRPLDGVSEAVVAAAREALVNAAKFSGEPRVSLYAEAEPTRLEVFVRDRGVGFDPAAVAPDRRGIAESIVGRLERVGGVAELRSTPGEGTEVRLFVSSGEDS